MLRPEPSILPHKTLTSQNQFFCCWPFGYDSSMILTSWILSKLLIFDFSWFYTMFLRFLASSWLLLGSLGAPGCPVDPPRLLQIPSIPARCLHFTPCFAMLRFGSLLGRFRSIVNIMHPGFRAFSAVPWDTYCPPWGSRACPWDLSGPQQGPLGSPASPNWVPTGSPAGPLGPCRPLLGLAALCGGSRLLCGGSLLLCEHIYRHI